MQALGAAVRTTAVGTGILLHNKVLHGVNIVCKVKEQG